MKTTVDLPCVIGVVGLAKNTGKTTTLNALIAHQTAEDVAITSIGLDGEAIDQITRLPKPRIQLRQGTVFATAADTLASATCEPDILETTPFATALGPVIIARSRQTGHALIAGPTSNRDLAALITRLKKHARRVYVDGAFNRVTFANVASLEGVVLATGAALNDDMETTLAKTAHVLRLFALPHTPESPADVLTIDTDEARHTVPQRHLSAVLNAGSSLRRVHWPGAFTERTARLLVNHRLANFTLVLDDATKAIIGERTMHHLDTLNITLNVRRPIRVVLITLNPYSPKGKHYDKDAFLRAAKAHFDVPVINVMDKEDPDHETHP